MNLNSYIIISILVHLLFTGLITATHSFTSTQAQVFNVKIVPPLEAEGPAAAENLKPEARKKKPVLVKKSLRKAEEKTLRPDTLYSGNTGPAGPPEKEETSLVPGFFLFDKKTIEKFASKAPPADRGLTFDTSEFKHRAYMRMLKERIESIWKYPREAEKLGLSGDLYIKFSIKKNGEMGEIELVRTSGYMELDRAAMNALKKAFPWWPLPKDYKGEKLTITGHFIYIFGSTYIL